MIPKSKMTIPIEGTPVVVWWEDAWSVAGADSPKVEFIERSNEGMLRVDCGWLVEKNADFILIAVTLDPHPRGGEVGYGGPNYVPRSLVRKIVPLCQSSPSRRSRSKSASSSRKKPSSPSASPRSPSPPSSTSPLDAVVSLTAAEFIEKYGSAGGPPGVLRPGPIPMVEPHDPIGICGIPQASEFMDLPEEDMEPDPPNFIP